MAMVRKVIHHTELNLVLLEATVQAWLSTLKTDEDIISNTVFVAGAEAHSWTIYWGP